MGGEAKRQRRYAQHQRKLGARHLSRFTATRRPRGKRASGLPYNVQGQMAVDEVVDGSPYGATSIAGGQGLRQPSATELDDARDQGWLIAETARKRFDRQEPPGRA